MKDAGAVLGVVGGGPGVLVVQAVLERAVDEDRELAGGRGDGFGLADPVARTDEQNAVRSHGNQRRRAGLSSTTRCASGLLSVLERAQPRRRNARTYAQRPAPLVLIVDDHADTREM